MAATGRVPRSRQENLWKCATKNAEAMERSCLDRMRLDENLRLSQVVKTVILGRTSSARHQD
jgi:hypothetical protein